MNEHDHHDHPHHHGTFNLTPLKWDPELEGEDLTPVVLSTVSSNLLPTSQPDVQVRKDQKTLTQAEKERLRAVLLELMKENGGYQDAISPHLGKYQMHSDTRVDGGTHRFLPWHRAFLRDVELKFQKKEEDLYGKPEVPLTLPYWRWTDPFPDWLPEQYPYPNTTPAGRTRKFVPGLKPTQQHINNLMEHWKQITDFPAGVSDYIRFAAVLEQGNQEDPAHPVFSHNHVHAHVGGLMNNRSLSPCDPVFWLHHAEVDRLWWIWQQNHPDETPAARFVEKLEPFGGMTYQKVYEVRTLGYTYDTGAY